MSLIPFPDGPFVAIVSRVENQAAPLVMSMRAHSTAVQDSLNDYRFGSANSQQIPGHRLRDSQARHTSNRTTLGLTCKLISKNLLKPTGNPPRFSQKKTQGVHEASTVFGRCKARRESGNGANRHEAMFSKLVFIGPFPPRNQPWIDRSMSICFNRFFCVCSTDG